VGKNERRERIYSLQLIHVPSSLDRLISVVHLLQVDLLVVVDQRPIEVMNKLNLPLVCTSMSLRKDLRELTSSIHVVLLGLRKGSMQCREEGGKISIDEGRPAPLSLGSGNKYPRNLIAEGLRMDCLVTFLSSSIESSG